jgi:type IV pilus assembly protein PilO
MTFTDFAPEDNQALEPVGPTYPTAFGVEFTPKVQGIAIGLLGLVGAFAVFNFLVQPAIEERQALENQVAQKEAEVAQQRASLQGIAELQAQLETALEQRVGIYGLLGDTQSLDTLLLDINQQIRNSNAAISDVLTVDFDRLDGGQLAALGLNPAQIQRVRTEFANDPVTQKLLYTSELISFSPGPATLLTDGPPELNNQLQRYTVDVSMQALFPQTLSIMRNIERLEPLIIIRDVQQTIAPTPQGVSEDQLIGITRLLQTNYTLEVLVPLNDPNVPPTPVEPEGEDTEGQ